MQKQSIAITSTFTAELIEESLDFWMRELNIPSEIEFAPYNQVFQQLLDPASLLSQNQNGINLVLVRFEDWLRFEEDGDAKANSSSGAYEKIERNVRDLILALKLAAGRSSTPYFVCLCPASSVALAKANLVTLFTQMEDLVASELDDVSSVHLVRTADLAALYWVENYHDPHGDKLGHIPYTQAFFASLGTILARKIYRLRSPRKK